MVRARFSAFALGLGEYIIATAHPEHPQASMRPQELRGSALRYRRVAIEESSLDEDGASVTFTATVFENGRDRSFRERSRFVRVDGCWRYHDAEALARR